jgi:hypothetical protein
MVIASSTRAWPVEVPTAGTALVAVGRPPPIFLVATCSWVRTRRLRIRLQDGEAATGLGVFLEGLLERRALQGFGPQC